jgi:hypothetical protein
MLNLLLSLALLCLKRSPQTTTKNRPYEASLGSSKIIFTSTSYSLQTKTGLAKPEIKEIEAIKVLVS